MNNFDTLSKPKPNILIRMLSRMIGWYWNEDTYRKIHPFWMKRIPRTSKFLAGLSSAITITIGVPLLAASLFGLGWWFLHTANQPIWR